MSTKISCLAVFWLILIFILPGNAGSQQTFYSHENQLDINNASFEQISRLPISTDLAERIYHRILYQGPLTSIYELQNIEGMNQELFLLLKPLIRIEPFAPRTQREDRIEQLYYRLDRWEANEGTNQALVDSWIEQALEPAPINAIRFDQLLNLQGVSPVDAAAIIRYRNRVGQITSLRDLRNAQHLSYYGYRNVRDFISFEPQQSRREFHGHLLFRVHNTPFLTEEAEATTAVVPAIEATNNYPDFYARFSGNYGTDFKIGFSHWHALFEPILNQKVGFLQIPRSKFYLGIENRHLGPLEIRKLYFGNYALAFGQGVVMENTDFFIPRKTGIGFRKRFIGLAGDNSRTRQYKLSGVAAELAFQNAHLFLFGSFDKRDAILNTRPIVLNGKPHYPVNQFIVLDQRFNFAPGDERRENQGLPWRDVVKELLYGLHFAYDLLPATQIGFTYYQSAYDRLLRPDIQEIVEADNLNQIRLADNEVFNSYGGEVSDGRNPFSGAAKSFRSVIGVNLQTVFQNLAFQAEYAELDKSSFLKNNPYALVANAYLQYNSFYLFGLYRNYSLGFDNPYQRSFSNYRRFKRTIFERFFYLQNSLYGQLYTNNPQPQAEEGFYIFSRYQINRKFVVTLENDIWRRKADDASQFRVVGTINFRPIFPLTISLRQKYQGREGQNRLTTEYFNNLEFRGTIRARLSRFDELGLLYVNAITKFRPRPRLYYPTQAGDSLETANIAGNIGSPGEALGGFYTHNFNERLKLKGFLGYYKGFFWTFEDTQFIVLDSQRGALRFWVSLYSRVSNSISMRIKFTRDYQYPITFFHSRDTDNEPIAPGNGKYYQANLIQNTQDFYYLELNYHF